MILRWLACNIAKSLNLNCFPQMRNLIIVLLVLCCNTSITRAQQISVKGIVSDTSEKKFPSNAVVVLLKKPDSILASFIRTGTDGKFSLGNVRPGNYVLIVTHPFFGDYVEDIEVKDADIDLGSIAVTPKAKLLQEVIVKSGAPMRVKGDTVEYTADSFKVRANANVEELLKKLPGIQVGKNGEIKAMGETVEKVLVDGEEFFGEDPGLVVKGMRADAVNKVQVFDKKSDQAEFTGIDDGKTKKTINLQLKEDKKKGYFGKIELAGGLKENYNNQFMFNAFKGKRKLSVYGLMGSIGQSGLNWNDAQNYGGNEGMSSGFDEESGGMWMSYNGGGDEDENYDYNSTIGFPRNWNVGVQYNNKWKNIHTLNSGYKFAKINLRSGSSAISQNFLPATTWFQNVTNTATNIKTKNSANANYDVKLDSMNSIKFTAKFSHTLTNNTNSSYTERINTEGFGVKSPVSRTSETTKDKFDASLLWRHKFKKLKRTLSWNTDFSYSQSDGDSYLLGSNNYYVNNAFDRKDSLDQFKHTHTNNKNVNSRLSYTEPLSKNFYMELNYTFSTAVADNNRNTFAKMPGDGKYESRIDSLSNNFHQNITTSKAGLNFRYVKKKFNYSFGSGIAYSSFKLQDVTRVKDYHYSYTNFFPQANFSYNIKQNRNLRVSYNGSTKQPSLNQLQPLIENNDPLNIYQGNPNLKQSFTHALNLSFNDYNFLKEQNLWSDVNVSFVQNEFSSAVITTDSGKTYTTPVNVNGTMNANLYGNYGFKWKKPDIRVYLGPQLGLNKNVDFQNSLKNKSLNYSLGFNTYMGKTKLDKYEINWRNQVTWNSNSNSIQNKAVRYVSYTGNIDGSYKFPKKFTLGSDVEFNVRQKTSEFDKNTNNTVWNAFLSKDLHEEMFTIKFSVNDILNQNNGFSRIATSNYFSQTIRERLQRYWLLTFTWNFSKNGKPSKGWD
jgi:Outer membrane protein beta-barrel family